MNKVLFRFLIFILVVMAIISVIREVNWFKLFQIEEVSLDLEKKIGDEIWKSMKITEPMDSSVARIEFVNSVKNKICLSNRFDTASINVHLVNRDIINAFAMPGGHLVVYTGLFKKCKSAEQLAGIMGHEIAHIQEKHVTKKLIKEVGLSVLVAITGGNVEGVKAVIEHLSSVAYDRKLEKEADLKSIEYLNAANINPVGLAEFMEELDKMDGELPEELGWFSTHPKSKERAKYIRKKVNSINKKYPPLNTNWDSFQN